MKLKLASIYKCTIPQFLRNKIHLEAITIHHVSLAPKKQKEKRKENIKGKKKRKRKRERKYKDVTYLHKCSGNKKGKERSFCTKV